MHKRESQREPGFFTRLFRRGGFRTDFNDYRESFPNNIFAGMFNFGEAPLFEITDESEREGVEVKF